MLLEFSDYQAMLSSVAVSEFAALEAYLQSMQQQAYDDLIDALQSKRYKELSKNWREFLASDFCQLCETESRQTIHDLANKRIAHVYTRAISEGNSITPASPVEEFHQLRKTCKKLRYLMEIFRNLYSSKKVKILINELKDLQDILGELQDLEVHIEILQDYLAQKYPEEITKQKSEDVIQQLIDRMNERKLTVQDKFQARFDSFASKKNRKRFKAMFGFKYH
jgi:CHAD domain-containing protein